MESRERRELPPQNQSSRQSFEMKQTANAKVSIPENIIPMIGFCKVWLIYGKGHTFLCEDFAGQLIGACFHEITNGKLIKYKFGCYLTIIKQSTNTWPSGKYVQGKIIESKVMNPKNKRPWVDYYMNVFQMNVVTESGQVYTKLYVY